MREVQPSDNYLHGCHQPNCKLTETEKEMTHSLRVQKGILEKYGKRNDPFPAGAQRNARKVRKKN